MMIDSKTLCLMWHLVTSEDPNIKLYDHQIETACYFSQQVIESSNYYQVDPFVVMSIIYNESRWTETITNKEGACGLGQIVYRYNPENESKKKCNKLLDGFINIKTISKLLSQNLNANKNNYDKALACYASGPKCSYVIYPKIILSKSKKLKNFYLKAKAKQIIENFKNTMYNTFNSLKEWVKKCIKLK